MYTFFYTKCMLFCIQNVCYFLYKMYAIFYTKYSIHFYTKCMLFLYKMYTIFHTKYMLFSLQNVCYFLYKMYAIFYTKCMLFSIEVFIYNTNFLPTINNLKLKYICRHIRVHIYFSSERSNMNIFLSSN